MFLLSSWAFEREIIEGERCDHWRSGSWHGQEPAARALWQRGEQSKQMMISSQPLTFEILRSVDSGVGPHHRSPASATEPAGQDLWASSLPSERQYRSNRGQMPVLSG